MTSAEPAHSRRSTPFAIACFSAVALYLGATVIGGTLVPGYSHIADSVSELTSSTGPHRSAIAWGFAAYNVAFAAMAWTLARTVRPSPSGSVATALWFVIAAAGIAMVSAFPQDPLGTPLTGPGTVHIVLAGIAAVGLIASAWLWTRAFRSDVTWAGLARGTFWFGWAILVVGGVGAALGGLVPEAFGLGERFTMVTYLGWFLWLGSGALRRPVVP